MFKGVNLKFGKTYSILFAILIPLSIVSLIISISIFNYLSNKKDEIFNISDIDFRYLDMNSTFYHYDEIGYETIIGVDLSEHNEEVDFQKLKEQNIKFVFLRIGWRGYLDPQLHLDKRFEEYYQKAKDVGMDIGIYFFSQAINQEEAIEEAQFVIDNLENKTINTYIAYDCESIDDVARTDDLTKQQATLNAKSFLETISNAGYNPMLYTNYAWIKNYYDEELLKEYPIWYAQYSKNPQYKKDHVVWQYASEMKIDGITNKDGVDLNLMIIKEDIN